MRNTWCVMPFPDGGTLLNSNPIIAFAATTDPTRAKEFYGKILGLRLVGEDGFAIEFDAGGTMLRVTPVRAHKAAAYTILGWIVQNIDWSIRDLMSRGIVFCRYDGLEQDKLGVWKSPSNAKIAWFHDPDGNTLSLTEFARPKKKSKPGIPKRRLTGARSGNSKRKTTNKRR